MRLSWSLLLAGSAGIVSTVAQQPSELWRTAYTTGNLPSSTALVGDRFLVFPQAPASIQIFNVTSGNIMHSQVIEQAGSSFYKVMQATPIPSSEGLLLTIDDMCETPPGSICSGRLWRYNTATYSTEWELTFPEFRPVNVGAVSPTTIVQQFSDGTIRGFEATTGDAIWTKTTALIVRGGGTFVGKDRAVFSGLGGRLEVYAVKDGKVVDSYTAPNPCVLDTPPLTEEDDLPSDEAALQACNNLFQRALVTDDHIYIVDDSAGLSQFDAEDVAAGPIWSNPFADGSQQSTAMPVIDENGIVYAMSDKQVGAVRSSDGTTVWVDDLASYGSNDGIQVEGDFIYTRAGTRLQSNRAASGERSWRVSAYYGFAAAGPTVFGSGDRAAAALDAILPTAAPTSSHSTAPSQAPSTPPSMGPTLSSTTAPSQDPTLSVEPSAAPTTAAPTAPPTASPTLSPSFPDPTTNPTSRPTSSPVSSDSLPNCSYPRLAGLFVVFNLLMGALM